jgi:copper(I)-binding protein
MALYEKYNRLAMPNMRLNQQEALDVLSYMEQEAERLAHPREVQNAPPAGHVVTIMDGWVREADPRARVNAGYMTLVNPGAEEVTLIKVESEVFENIEMHEMARVDGSVEMKRLPELTIPPKGQARLEPGGKHLMLMGPRAQFAAGQKVDMTLTFQSGKRQHLSIHVEPR